MGIVVIATVRLVYVRDNHVPPGSSFTNDMLAAVPIWTLLQQIGCFIYIQHSHDDHLTSQASTVNGVGGKKRIVIVRHGATQYSEHRLISSSVKRFSMLLIWGEDRSPPTCLSWTLQTHHVDWQAKTNQP